MENELIKTVRTSFIEHFNNDPLMVFSPGRINLIGEHTDYNEGFVFPAAIDKGIALAIQKSDKKKCHVYALDKQESYEFDLESIVSLEPITWRNYILGTVAEIHNLGLKVDNFNLVFAGNIDGGAGLSSSAALENSVVFGLNELFHLELSKEQMILISQKAEHNFVGVKCGIMDQYASMFGEKQKALLLDCRTVSSQSYTINFHDSELLLINTHVKHNLSDSAYNERKEACEYVCKTLNKPALRDVTKKELAQIQGDIKEEYYQQALYVIEENDRVHQFVKAIETDNVEKLGELLYQSHDGLSKQYKVSCTELDFLVNKAKENPVFLGARMMGGGFGGCTINLVKLNSENVINKILLAYESEFNIKPSLYSIRLSDGVKIVS